MFFDYRAWLVIGVDRSKRVLTSLAVVPIMAGALSACDVFDGQSNQAPIDISSAVPSVTAPDFGEWQVSESVNPLNDQKSVNITLLSQEGGYTLGVICRGDASLSAVMWNEFLGGNKVGEYELKKVTYRIGGGKASEAEWLVEGDRTTTSILFPEDFIDEVRTSNNLVLQTSPYNSLPKTAVFDTTGLTAVLNAHRPDCNLFLRDILYAEKLERLEAEKAKQTEDEPAKDRSSSGADALATTDTPTR